MSPKLDRTLTRKHDLEVGYFYFYKNFVISEIKEGMSITFENATEMLRLAKTYFGNTTPFVYISNRKNSYSFNPTAHFKTTQMFPNIKGFAAVVYDDMNRDIAEMEQSFLNVPVNIFTHLDKAIDWAEEIIVMD
ncbi:hypothetical protein [Costertonia aggregata]|uniref:STAS/SEC14 domain-containing protein n=1 Tax=Costertonia aggregata TaxID=343403 RepID=A0A7H9ANW9_9FLAO|nr:hypothetical protein [Costertonia aggregata]QLG45130.1 hypothetical protein HYG79_07125 [Costertonia aggregata]